jgi:uncharacterized protein YjdB
MFRTAGVVAVLMGIMAGVGCSPDIVAVAISPGSASLAKANQTAQLTAISIDRNAMAVPDRTHTWKSGNERVAVVDATGKVTAKGDGQAMITATDAETEGDSNGPMSAVARISVSLPTRLEIIPTALTLKTGEPPVTLRARVLDGRGVELPGKTVTWSVDKPLVSVTADGKVTASGVGTATITGMSEGLTHTAPVIVTPGAPVTDGGVIDASATASTPPPR